LQGLDGHRIRQKIAYLVIIIIIIIVIVPINWRGTVYCRVYRTVWQRSTWRLKQDLPNSLLSCSSVLHRSTPSPR